MTDFTIDVKDEGEITIVTLTGSIDSETFNTLQKRMQKIFDEQKFKIVIDLGAITYVSSAGWGTFTGNLKKARVGFGDIKLACMNENIKNVYDIVELNDLIKAYATVEEAVNAYKS